MAQDFTLPGNRSVLYSLSEEQRTALAPAEIDRLFGLNDVGADRLLRFAPGHHCAIADSDSSVVFEKRQRS